ncbi:FlgK family flagellar hook-associated protein [Sphingomonas aliaeris]|uniref:FlgK family flagellar hook-associated protein n=1 Tax=Sphingomonas aliaeris TaxID=2759526 RepID=UPI001CEDF9B2|nr:flagellar basal body protein [Sphingomonas aliaeris]
MSDLLGIGASGVRAYQSALTTTSENIANASTPGYTRRTSTINEISSTGGSVVTRTANDVNGALLSGVKRADDMFRSAEVRTAGADLARSETSIAWMGRIETTLSGNQLGDRLTSFFNAAKAIAADPTATTPRQAMLESATSVASSFGATGKGLIAIEQDIDATADAAVATLNGLGVSLAKVNSALARVQPDTAAAAQLGDQRDQLLEQMSAISDVNVVTDDFGRATVRLGGGRAGLRRRHRFRIRHLRPRRGRGGELRHASRGYDVRAFAQWRRPGRCGRRRRARYCRTGFAGYHCQRVRRSRQQGARQGRDARYH